MRRVPVDPLGRQGEGGADGLKFDLDRWNPAYFQRLKDFCRKAGERGVVVELVLFCRMYSDDLWRLSPLHPDNNLQGEEWRGMNYERFITLDNAALVQRQKAVIRKLVTELSDVPNVYFEVCNEPGLRNSTSETAKVINAWHEAIIAEIVAAEASLPAESRHLIAFNDHSPDRGVAPIPGSGAVGVVNFHYLPRMAARLSARENLKALGFDETHWIDHPRYPEYRNTMKPLSGRAEVWEFIIGGGSVYSNLNYAYQVENPTGKGPESDEFKKYLRNLKQFVTSFDFIRMRPDSSVIAGGLAREESFLRALARPGSQYAIYIHHSRYAARETAYNVDERPRTLDLVLDLPRGSYRVEWVQPIDLTVPKTQLVKNHAGGRVNLETSPKHVGDIALKILSAR